MKELIESLQKATENKNWHAALFIALAIPDICGKFEYPSKKSGERYKKWFNEYLKEFFIHKVGAMEEEITFLNTDDYYSLRCALLHEKNDEIRGQQSKSILNKFVFSTTLNHLLKIDNKIQKTLILNVEVFCNKIYSAISK